MLAISVQVVILCPNGTRDSTLRRVSSGFGTVASQVAYMGVQHSATITELTRMPYFSSSIAHSLVRAFRPPFAAAYAEVAP